MELNGKDILKFKVETFVTYKCEMVEGKHLALQLDLMGGYRVVFDGEVVYSGGGPAGAIKSYEGITEG